MPLYPALIAATFAFAAGILIYNEWDAISEAWESRKKRRVACQFGHFPQRSSSLIHPRQVATKTGATTGYSYQNDIRSRLSTAHNQEYQLDEYDSRHFARSIVRESAERDYISRFASNRPTIEQTRGLSQAEIYGFPSTEDLDDHPLATPTVPENYSRSSTPTVQASGLEDGMDISQNNSNILSGTCFSGSSVESPVSPCSPFVSARASEDEWTNSGISTIGEDWSLIDSGSEKKFELFANEYKTKELYYSYLEKYKNDPTRLLEITKQLYLKFSNLRDNFQKLKNKYRRNLDRWDSWYTKAQKRKAEKEMAKTPLCQASNSVLNSPRKRVKCIIPKKSVEGKENESDTELDSEGSPQIKDENCSLTPSPSNTQHTVSPFENIKLEEKTLEILPSDCHKRHMFSATLDFSTPGTLKLKQPSSDRFPSKVSSSTPKTKKYGLPKVSTPQRTQKRLPLLLSPSVARENKGRGRYASMMKKPTQLDPTDFIVNPAQNNGIKYAYNEVIRGKEARKALHAYDCHCSGPPPPSLAPRWRSCSPESKDVIQKVSRHRANFGRASTPPGFWNSEFPDTQTQEQVRQEAAELRRRRALEREAESKKPGGGRFIKR